MPTQGPLDQCSSLSWQESIVAAASERYQSVVVKYTHLVWSWTSRHRLVTLRIVKFRQETKSHCTESVCLGNPQVHTVLQALYGRSSGTAEIGFTRWQSVNFRKSLAGLGHENLSPIHN